MDQISFAIRYAIYPFLSEADIVLEKNHVVFLFYSEDNTLTSLFQIGSTTHSVEHGNCLSFLTTDDQQSLSSDEHPEQSFITCLLTIPQNQIDFAILKRLHQEKIAVTFSNSRIEFLLKEVVSTEKNKSCRFRTSSILFELISLQLERLANEGTETDGQAHYDKILYTKRLIEENLAHSYTIPELARFAGTNEQYLKKYFKLYLGKTISQYTLEIKMNYAKNLLTTGKHRVADIARMIGYKHSTHFTTAFKKYFGFIPNSLRY